MHTFLLFERLLHAVFTLPRLLSRNREMFDRILEQSEVGQEDNITDEPVQSFEPTPFGSNETSDQQTKKEKLKKTI